MNECLICGEFATDDGADYCDRCWEIESRIEDLPYRALLHFAKYIVEELEGRLL